MYIPVRILSSRDQVFIWYYMILHIEKSSFSRMYTTYIVIPIKKFETYSVRNGDHNNQQSFQIIEDMSMGIVFHITFYLTFMEA